jgi:beta-phosphoglucomutase-like phosphatase (HAD superfamily)
MIELVVFDMAGTTVYDGDAVLHSLQAALQSEGMETERDEVNAVMGMTKPAALLLIRQRSIGCTKSFWRRCLPIIANCSVCRG